MDREKENKLKADLDCLSDNVIKARLWSHAYRGDGRTFVEQYLEDRDLARHQRFTQRDRNIQKWIMGIAAAGLVVGIVSLAATIFNIRI